MDTANNGPRSMSQPSYISLQMPPRRMPWKHIYGCYYGLDSSISRRKAFAIVGTPMSLLAPGRLLGGT
jgi:hypothetical protein